MICRIKSTSECRTKICTRPNSHHLFAAAKLRTSSCGSTKPTEFTLFHVTKLHESLAIRLISMYLYVARFLPVLQAMFCVGSWDVPMSIHESKRFLGKRVGIGDPIFSFLCQSFSIIQRIVTYCSV